jgi:uncharacterized protein YbcI
VSEQDTAAEAAYESRRALLRRISQEMTGAQKREFGQGPVSVRSYLFDDLLQVVMRDGLTVAEKSMVRFGRGDTVRSFRQEFQDGMAKQLIDLVEQATERKVINFASQIMFEPDIVISTFVFDRADGGFVHFAVR